MVAWLKKNFSEWVSKALLGVITWLAIGIYNKVDTMAVTMPVMQQQIKTLEESNNRINNKVFPIYYSSYFLKPRIYSIKDIIPAKQ